MGTSRADAALCGVGLLSVFLYSGIIFGWAPLQQMLLREGQFSELCPPATNHTDDAGCPAQLSQLDLVFTLSSSALSLVSLPVGIFLDRYGPRAAVSLSAACVVGGLVLLAFSDSKRLNGFTPAMVLLAAGGSLNMLAAFPISFRFPVHQPAVLAVRAPAPRSHPRPR